MSICSQFGFVKVTLRNEETGDAPIRVPVPEVWSGLRGTDSHGRENPGCLSKVRREEAGQVALRFQCWIGNWVCFSIMPDGDVSLRSTMRKSFSFWGVVLFVSAVVLLPAVHKAVRGACCAQEQACNAEEKSDRDTHPEGSRNHDSSTCLICKVSGTPLIAASPIALRDTPHTTSGAPFTPASLLLPRTLPGSRWARAPPQ